MLCSYFTILQFLLCFERTDDYNNNDDDDDDGQVEDRDANRTMCLCHTSAAVSLTQEHCINIDKPFVFMVRQ